VAIPEHVQLVTQHQPVTMDEMIVLAKSAHRGPNTFLIGDMPQGLLRICERMPCSTLAFIKEAGCTP